jgi:hypothetical protein
MTEKPEKCTEATIVAGAAFSAPLAEVESWRHGTWLDGNTGPSINKVLRNADEQTIAGFRALVTAMNKVPDLLASRHDWAVIGCPKFLGRMIICGTISRYFQEHRFSISPHIIPNYTLHAQSGAISIGLTMHGANFGVGGGPGNVPEGLLTGLSVVGEGSHPGVWLVLSEFDPEPIPDDCGKPTNDVYLHAIALAFQATQSAQAKGVGQLQLDRAESTAGSIASVRTLVDWWRRPDARRWSCAYPGLGVLCLEKSSAE